MAVVEMRPARAGEEFAQKALWKMTFGDDDALIDLCYAQCGGPENRLVLIEDGQLRSILTLLPLTLVGADGAQFSSCYVYALATAAAARGQGFGRALLHYTDYVLQERGVDCVTVVPAEASLYKFFHTAGFDACFFLRETELSALPPADRAARVTPLSAAAYGALRESLLAKERHVAYGEALIALQQGFSRLAGADLYQIEVGGATGCAAAERINADSVRLQELLLPPPQMLPAVAALAEKLPAARYFLRTPAFCPGPQGGYVQPYGMVKWYHAAQKVAWGADGAYLGFGFD